MFGPSASPYKVSHSGTESAVVLQCLTLLAAFRTPLGRDFSDFFTTLGRDFSDFLRPLGDGRLCPLSLPALIEVFHFLNLLIPGSPLLDKSLF